MLKQKLTLKSSKEQIEKDKDFKLYIEFSQSLTEYLQIEKQLFLLKIKEQNLSSLEINQKLYKYLKVKKTKFNVLLDLLRKRLNLNCNIEQYLITDFSK
jgi:hypothetical protein